MESMKAVALAAKARSLADFQKAVKAYKVKWLSFTDRQELFRHTVMRWQSNKI